MITNLSKCHLAEVKHQQDWFETGASYNVCTACGLPCELVEKPAKNEMFHGEGTSMPVTNEVVKPSPKPSGRLLSTEEIRKLRQKWSSRDSYDIARIDYMNMVYEAVQAQDAKTYSRTTAEYQDEIDYFKAGVPVTESMKAEITELRAKVAYEKDKLGQLAEYLNFWGDPIGKLKADHHAKLERVFQEIERHPDIRVGDGGTNYWIHKEDLEAIKKSLLES